MVEAEAKRGKTSECQGEPVQHQPSSQSADSHGNEGTQQSTVCEGSVSTESRSEIKRDLCLQIDCSRSWETGKCFCSRLPGSLGYSPARKHQTGGTCARMTTFTHHPSMGPRMQKLAQGCIETGQF